MTDRDAAANPSDQVAAWLEDFEAALAKPNASRLAELFNDDCHWRDLVALTWHLRTFSGRDAIAGELAEIAASAKPRNFRINEDHTPPHRVKRAGVETIEATIRFETETGQASGVLRLVPTSQDPTRFSAWVLLTALNEIKGHEQQIGARRPRGEEWSGGFGSENWMDVRRKQIAYEDREPAVVVIGGSQSGLGIAACLNVLSVV